jgi:hypothetical protein
MTKEDIKNAASYQIINHKVLEMAASTYATSTGRKFSLNVQRVMTTNPKSSGVAETVNLLLLHDNKIGLIKSIDHADDTIYVRYQFMQLKF